MPEISLFFGIRVTMYYDDHNPPHFHAEYNENKVLVDIIKGRIIKGYFPSRQLKFVLAWAEIHKDELMKNWELAKEDKPLKEIAPSTMAGTRSFLIVTPVNVGLVILLPLAHLMT